VTIRHEQRDLADMRGLHHNRFLCRAMNAAHAGRTMTLKDLPTARVRHRRALRTAMHERLARGAAWRPEQAPSHPPQTAAPHRRSAPKLETSFEDQP